MNLVTRLRAVTVSAGRAHTREAGEDTRGQSAGLSWAELLVSDDTGDPGGHHHLTSDNVQSCEAGENMKDDG